MVSVVSSSPTGGNFIFLRHLDVNFVQKCQNVRFVLFTKTSIVLNVHQNLRINLIGTLLHTHLQNNPEVQQNNSNNISSG